MRAGRGASCTWCGSVADNPEFRPLPASRPGGAGNPALVEVVFPRFAAEDANAAMDQLFRVLPDHEPILTSTSAEAWTFDLRWTSDPAFVDPGVLDTAARMYGLGLEEIGGHHEVMRWEGRDVVFSLVHGWALLAAALAVVRRSGAPLSWIVHVDDHTDMGAVVASPAGRVGFVQDQIFDTEIHIGDPDSVIDAVKRGTVSKGNFLTAYLLAYPGTEVVQVGARVREGSYALVPRMEPMNVGSRVLPGSTIPLEGASASGAPAFLKTRRLPAVLPGGGSGGVWLDIDLDFFCNRYDGDSDRRGWTAALDEEQRVMERVHGFLAELAKVDWLAEVEAVSVAVSPGFFPSDHWSNVIGTLKDGIQKVLGA